MDTPQNTGASSSAHNDGADEPLLGRPGDATQKSDQTFASNVILGTAGIAQAGIWILALSVWVAIFTHPAALAPLFAPHPLLNSAGLLLTTQAILLLQPTHTPTQKRQGAHLHGAFNAAGLLCLLAAFVMIEVNKLVNGLPHVHSPHAVLGLIVYVVFILQAIVGVTQFYTPSVYGGVDNAKRVWKYHRMSGYVLLVLSLVTVCLATQTDFVKGAIHLELWATIVSSLLILIGILPRVKKQKLGFK